MIKEKLTISFKCSHCGEMLPFEQKDSSYETSDTDIIVCDYHHDCFGEAPGLIGLVNKTSVTALDPSEVEIVVG